MALLQITELYNAGSVHLSPLDKTTVLQHLLGHHILVQRKCPQHLHLISIDILAKRKAKEKSQN